jgi:hypothetical protein
MPLPLVISEVKTILLAEVSHIHGFMQLLMKPRNGMRWSVEDRTAIRVHLRHLTRSLPVLLIFTLPGGSLLLPLLAWFLDRRKIRNQPTTNPVSSPTPVETATTSTSGVLSSSELVEKL